MTDNTDIGLLIADIEWDVKDIDSMEKALEVGINLVRHLPEPLEKETSEKLNEIADCLNLLTKFVIAEARYTRIRKDLQDYSTVIE